MGSHLHYREQKESKEKWKYTWSYLLQVKSVPYSFTTPQIWCRWNTTRNCNILGKRWKKAVLEKDFYLMEDVPFLPAYLRDSCILLFPLPHLSTRWQVMPNYFGISYCIVSFHHLPMPVAHQAWKIKSSNLLETGKRKKKDTNPPHFKPKIETFILY